MTIKKIKRAARIILVGAPGVGKGTQAERLMKRYPQISAVSSGELLRASVRQKSPLGALFPPLGRSGPVLVSLVPTKTPPWLI